MCRLSQSQLLLITKTQEIKRESNFVLVRENVKKLYLRTVVFVGGGKWLIWGVVLGCVSRPEEAWATVSGALWGQDMKWMEFPFQKRGHYRSLVTRKTKSTPHVGVSTFCDHEFPRKMISLDWMLVFQDVAFLSSPPSFLSQCSDFQSCFILQLTIFNLSSIILSAALCTTPLPRTFFFLAHPAPPSVM